MLHQSEESTLSLVELAQGKNYEKSYILRDVCCIFKRLQFHNHICIYIYTYVCIYIYYIHIRIYTHIWVYVCVKHEGFGDSKCFGPVAPVLAMTTASSFSK